ncbi:MAG TPA: CoA pyrophosphatase [Actinomycetota bacterium]|nr:CoA pyrophosphatase [Actinomycetota bacterium]
MSADDLIAGLAERLQETQEDANLEGWAMAAVLVPLVKHQGEWRLVFTRRSEDLTHHAGEISFPGGRIDEGETPAQAAVRETHEELAVPPQTVELIGRLPSVPTRVSGYLIEPWVGLIESNEFDPNPAEIAEVIEISLETITGPGVERVQKFIRGGGVYESFAYDIGPNIIWGATGRIVRNLIELLPEPKQVIS